MKERSLLIVDDEYSVRENIKFLIKTFHDDQFGSISEAATFEQALIEYGREEPDILFLDINLGARNGFDFLDQVKGGKYRVIFITAYNEYAIKAFKYAASNYLLKPLDIDEFNEAVNRALSEVPKSAEPVRAFLAPADNHNFDFFFVPDKNGWAKIMSADILYLEANRSYTHIITECQTYMVTRSMNKFDFLLEDQASFLKIHRSFIINVRKVKIIYKKQGGIVLMNNDVEIPISASERERVYRLFNID